VDPCLVHGHLVIEAHQPPAGSSQASAELGLLACDVAGVEPTDLLQGVEAGHEHPSTAFDLAHRPGPHDVQSPGVARIGAPSLAQVTAHDPQLRVLGQGGLAGFEPTWGQAAVAVHELNESELGPARAQGPPAQVARTRCVAGRGQLEDLGVRRRDPPAVVA
jgi:hypothetical protein